MIVNWSQPSAYIQGRTTMLFYSARLGEIEFILTCLIISNASGLTLASVLWRDHWAYNSWWFPEFEFCFWHLLTARLEVCYISHLFDCCFSVIFNFPWRFQGWEEGKNSILNIPYIKFQDIFSFSHYFSFFFPYTQGSNIAWLLSHREKWSEKGIHMKCYCFNVLLFLDFPWVFPLL